MFPAAARWWAIHPCLANVICLRSGSTKGLFLDKTLLHLLPAAVHDLSALMDSKLRSFFPPFAMCMIY